MRILAAVGLLSAQDRQRLIAERHAVRPFPFFHPLLRDGPCRLVTVEAVGDLVPRHAKDFAGSRGGQDQESKRLRRRSRRLAQPRHEGWDLVVGHGGVVAALGGAHAGCGVDLADLLRVRQLAVEPALPPCGVCPVRVDVSVDLSRSQHRFDSRTQPQRGFGRLRPQRRKDAQHGFGIDLIDRRRADRGAVPARAPGGDCWPVATASAMARHGLLGLGRSLADAHRWRSCVCGGRRHRRGGDVGYHRDPRTDQDDCSFGREARCRRSQSVSRHARSGDDPRPRRRGLGQKHLSARFDADGRAIARQLPISPMHQQGWVRGVARCLHHAGHSSNCAHRIELAGESLRRTQAKQSRKA